MLGAKGYMAMEKGPRLCVVCAEAVGVEADYLWRDMVCGRFRVLRGEVVFADRKEALAQKDATILYLNKKVDALHDLLQELTRLEMR